MFAPVSSDSVFKCSKGVLPTAPTKPFTKLDMARAACTALDADGTATRLTQLEIMATNKMNASHRCRSGDSGNKTVSSERVTGSRHERASTAAARPTTQICKLPISNLEKMTFTSMTRSTKKGVAKRLVVGLALALAHPHIKSHPIKSPLPRHPPRPSPPTPVRPRTCFVLTFGSRSFCFVFAECLYTAIRLLCHCLSCLVTAAQNRTCCLVLPDLLPPRPDATAHMHCLVVLSALVAAWGCCVRL